MERNQLLFDSLMFKWWQIAAICVGCRAPISGSSRSGKKHCNDLPCRGNHGDFKQSHVRWFLSPVELFCILWLKPEMVRLKMKKNGLNSDYINVSVCAREMFLLRRWMLCFPQRSNAPHQKQTIFGIRRIRCTQYSAPGARQHAILNLPPPEQIKYWTPREAMVETVENSCCFHAL